MDMILKNTFQSTSPAYELIGDVTVGTATTQVDFTGLNIGKDDELLLVSDWINSYSSGHSMLLRVNGNTTATAYWYQGLTANSTSVTGERYNNQTMTWADSLNQRNLTLSKFKLSNSGYIVRQSETLQKYGGSSTFIFNTFATSTFTADSITSLSIVTTATNGIGTGSRFQLYKLVAEKVADIIVPSNTTSVDITGLNIGKDGEYYLVSDFYNPTASDVNYQLFVNNNTTSTNYYFQRINAVGTGDTGNKANDSSIGYTYPTPSRYSFSASRIKLTNSGYAVTQSDGTYTYGGGGVHLSKRYNTSTFTASAITQLTITASVTNVIGANSRFTLYKLK